MNAADQYEFLACLLFAIVLLELVARKLRLPPAAAFVLDGMALALMAGGFFLLAKSGAAGLSVERLFDRTGSTVKRVR